MSSFYLNIIFVILTILTIVGLGMMVIIEAALERIQKIEREQAKQESDMAPLMTLIAESQPLQALLIERAENKEAKNG